MTFANAKMHKSTRSARLQVAFRTLLARPCTKTERLFLHELCTPLADHMNKRQVDVLLKKIRKVTPVLPLPPPGEIALRLFGHLEPKIRKEAIKAFLEELKVM